MFILLSSSNGKITIPIRELNIDDGCFLVYKHGKKLMLKRIGDLNDVVVYVRVQVNNVPGIKANVMLKLAEYSELKTAKFEEKGEEIIIHLVVKVIDNNFFRKISDDLRETLHVKKCDISILNHSLD
ncbi:MAG: hypothetical protein QW534_08160 [Candidatus Methanomethylicia archaeon]